MQKEDEMEQEKKDPRKRRERGRLFAYAGLLLLVLFGIKGVTVGMHSLTRWIVTQNEQRIEALPETEEGSESISTMETEETGKETEPVFTIETEERKEPETSVLKQSGVPAGNPETAKKGGNN